ncbi:hypothetical protein DCD76_16775 [Acinetobacter baumannii]|nr:hypothetical protein DCD76_16775 [Acinetobacter baumannii]
MIRSFKLTFVLFNVNNNELLYVVPAPSLSIYNCVFKPLTTVFINGSKLVKLIYAELSGDFPLGDSRQPIYKSLRPFDLVS